VNEKTYEYASIFSNLLLKNSALFIEMKLKLNSILKIHCRI